MSNILVTGGAGFIGRHVVDLLAHTDTPLVFDRKRATTTILGDIRDPVAVTEAAAHADAIIHLAGVLGTQETIDNPHPAAEINILGGLNILDAARQYKIPLVYIAVGNHWMDNSYSITKTTVERFCRMYRTEHDVNVSVVRAMNAYGPRQTPASPFGPGKVRKIMPAFICRALTGQPIEIYGDGAQIMDMIYVTDVARTLVSALGMNGDYEAGTCRATTVLQIARTVLDTVGEGEIRHLPMRPGEPEQSVVIAHPANTLCSADVLLEEGVGQTVDWYRNNWLPAWQSHR
jgi:UDP-glucose 4-epimerase